MDVGGVREQELGSLGGQVLGVILGAVQVGVLLTLAGHPALEHVVAQQPGRALIPLVLAARRGCTGDDAR